MPDFNATLLNYQVTSDTIWMEWEWGATRKDQSRLHMRGVCIFSLDEELITGGRLYMEPVEVGGVDINAAISQVMQGRD